MHLVLQQMPPEYDGAHHVREAIRPARIYLAEQLAKNNDSYAVAAAAEYVLPHKARALLVRHGNEDPEVAINKFRSALNSLPLVLKPADAVDPNALRAQMTLAKNALCNEIVDYLAQAYGIDDKADIVEFWNARSATLPNFFRLFVLVCTLQASSAAAERVLSVYQLAFGNRNAIDVKEDYVEATLISRDVATHPN